jgi:hypothetical protein
MPSVKATSKKYPEAHRRAAHRYQERHRRVGLCVKCSRPAVAETVYCVVHREYMGLRPRWSSVGDSTLRAAWREGVPAREIAARLGRPVVSVKARAKRLGLLTQSVRTRRVRTT